jgi:hypothetical protein
VKLCAKACNKYLNLNYAYSCVYVQCCLIHALICMCQCLEINYVCFLVNMFCLEKLSGPVFLANRMFQFAKSKQHDTIVIWDPCPGSCVACQASWVVRHSGHLAPHSLQVGTKATHQPCWSTRHGWVTREASQHTHDSEGSVRPLISSGTIPRKQRRTTTRCVEHKATKELPSLVPLFSGTLFSLCKYFSST